jgi:hypothetical protein
MRSDDLDGHGFGAWHPFNKKSKAALISALPAKHGTYAIRCSKDYGRSRGVSDILYFGSAANHGGLKNRIRQYFSPGPTQTTNIRILALVGDCSDFQIAFRPAESVQDAKTHESLLLHLYEQDHGELPPQNRRH